ncbi:glycoside hydrolase family 6 protein [Streptosporangium sp. NBC_01639]|uniref:glycoside hydrolase family 6 protein n=1 Tax=Streptosporangium sp. NBC_01639 TaxID=2975948 RepID=UPI0038635DA2|nr:glycoside hydrolase family 6 protein [Streptosporangium sp. NBC_01639]
MNRYGRAITALAFAFAAAACGDDSSSAPAASGAPRFYVDPGGAAAGEVRKLEQEGKTEDAALIRKIADRPNAIWIGDEDPQGRVADITAKAQESGQVPVLVAYRIPDRDCGQFSAGGATSAEEYRSWIGRFAEGIGDRPAWVIVEPDALAHILDSCTQGGRAAERLDLLRGAVQTLKKKPKAKVYLDAGNAGWIQNADDWAEPMRQAGVTEADGFAFNVSNFFSTEDSVAAARRLSDGLGGVHYVIDTSRNGNGPLREGEGTDSWCNPQGRALGAEPTTRTGHERVDAFLWVKRPGESDGDCHRGEPKPGDWFPAYALELARNAK